MYFWRIEDLKYSLVVKPPSQLESLKYLAALLIAKACLAMEIVVHNSLVHPDPAWRIPDLTASIVGPLSGIVGIVYCFVKNGGRTGSSFLQRLVALYWVMVIRFTVIVFVPSAVLLALICRSASRLVLVLWPVSVILVVLFYWRLGSHFADVQEHERMTQPKPDVDGPKPEP
jgi:Ca2+/H+ antiporter